MMKGLGGGRLFRPKTDDLPAVPGLVRLAHPPWPNPQFYSKRSTGTIQGIDRQRSILMLWTVSNASYWQYMTVIVMNINWLTQSGSKES